MALLLAEGFDYWNSGITDDIKLAGGWTYQGAYPSTGIELNGGRHGINCGYASGYWSKVLTPSEASTTLVLGVGLYQTSDLDVCTFGAGSLNGVNPGDCVPNVTVNVSSDGRVRVYQGWGPAGKASVTSSGGSPGTLLAQSAVINFNVGAWKYLEVKATSISVIVNVDDIQVVNVAHTGTVFDNFFIWGGFRMDDVYLLNGTGAPNTFVGTGARVEYTMSSADNSVSWTPSGGTDHWSLLDSQNAYGDPIGNGWVTSDVTDAVELLEVGNLSPLGAEDTLLGVVVSAMARKLDTGPRSIAIIASAEGTTVQSADMILTQYVAPTYDFSILERILVLSTQPNGSPWTEIAFNAAKFGFKTR